MKANKKKGWVPRWKAIMPESWTPFRPDWSPELSNHLKMKLREEQRRQVKEKKD